ncbi:MAG: glutamyl-tRNA reductase [Actinomycetia bacterium]|nr:glutamyl-tRNA reductase [Actinomycetes bacterium]MCP4962177.1 glutamyl-tRNA reductase [Actinomycetes bacterium]
MSILTIGLNHASAPLDLLERLAIRDDDIDKVLHGLFQCDNVGEVVVLSTCNRTEVYAVAERFHGAFDDIRNVLSDRVGLADDALVDHLYVYYDDEAVRHLFRVTSGLDSAVLGESEILGQVKTSWEIARANETAASTLNLLFRHAVECGKRARTETGIGRNIASVSQAAVAMATERLGTLDATKILVVGAGEMATGMLESLAGAGAAELLIANRTAQRAADLASRVGGRAISLPDLGPELADVDVLLTSTGATSIIVDHAGLAAAVEGRGDHPLVIVDVAVPRDVDPSVSDLPGVTLLDMDDLSEFAAVGRRERGLEIAAVDTIVTAEVSRFADVRSAREVAPLVTSLRTEAEAIRRREIERASFALSELSAEQLASVENMSQRLVAKLLHNPTINVKDAAGTPRGDRLADSLRDLFGL